MGRFCCAQYVGFAIMKFGLKTTVTVFALGCAFLSSSVLAGEFNRAWFSKNTSIILDAYEYTPIDWSKMSNNTRLAGFINKASDGLSPKASCGRNILYRVKWRRYVAARELYHTRRILAKTLGMEWGAYHLARPGNPIEQAEHFLNFAKPDKDDLIALDIEHNDPKKWMSLADAEIFARHIKQRTGRYPVLYTNHTTSKFIAANKHEYKLLSRMHLWYARYKPEITGVFPMGDWKSYTIWQFSSMVNCNDKTCPWRIKGAGNWIDVNVVNMAPKKLRAAWPFAKLPKPLSPPVEQIPVAQQKQPISKVVASANSNPSDPGIDPVVTGAVPSASAPVRFVKPASLLVETPVTSFPRNMWIAADKVIKPKWRSGTAFARRVPYLTSDAVVHGLN